MNAAAMARTLQLIDRLAVRVKLYRLGCNMNIETARVAFEAMGGMKLKDGFIAHDTGFESILVPMGGAGWSGVVKGNKTRGAIFDLLKADTAEAAIIDAMAERFDAPEEIIARDVKKALSELRKIGAAG